ncbi:substrate-binding domain-containing protein [Burkholderia sp. Ac-20392]|uniref:substrate-binding domain-containing protein n=1 Tax=Burkholderia sp. Ac-20392 TaxID=2703905 RepID=UPI00197E7D19|nr:substrate-binding domain-containing protein [Burkholderia sp. Ac-20392]MBN3795894.1 phosphate ABC transporter substrate-binding protein [Burkholderia sp. Ac-20392]
MRFHQRKLCRLIALLITGMSASASMAFPVVMGGGSSNVAPMIGGIGKPATEIGLFGTAEGSFTYYSVDSAAGQNAFLNNQPSYFGAGITGTVAFANSDAALTTAQLTVYRFGRGATDGPLIQIPYVVTPITIPIVNGPTVTSTATPQTTPGQAHSIALNDDDLCGIFSGKLTRWNQVVNPETGSTYPINVPITVVYRVDGSGTTELLTRHLATVCTNANTAPGVTFVDSMTFANSFPGGVPVGPSFVGATHSASVRNVLTSMASAGIAAVAYLGPSWTNTFLAPSSVIASSPGAYQLPVASLVNARNGLYYAPSYANASVALGPVTPPRLGAAASNQANWVPSSGNPLSGYPVSGTSQIVLSQCYADPAVATALHDYLNAHYNSAAFASIIHGNGFDTVPSVFKTAISNDFLSNVSGFNLDIGNTSVCAGTGR